MRKIEMGKAAGSMNQRGAARGSKPGMAASPRSGRATDITEIVEELEEKVGASGKKGARRSRPKKAPKVAKGQGESVENVKKPVVIPANITVRDLADLLHASPIDVIKVLMANGVLANINQVIDFDEAAIVASELGFEIAEEKEEAEEKEAAEEARAVERRILREDFYADEREEDLVSRPPVVTVLGHVDHGKTTLLDAIRRTNVVDSEAGGITQRIGAYQVEYEGQKITFIDTPGHEAFTAMRARGAQATDIAVLVVAADDGVMPQTLEAIDHARAAGVPIVVAASKIDRANANVERVKQQLAEQGLTPDDWGGDTLVVPVSALQAEGIEELLEAILLVAEEIDPRANPNARAAGTVIESVLDRFRGPLATLLVQNGTLKLGDVVVVETVWGRVRAMFDENGDRMKEAPPSTPAQVMGLAEVPPAGSIFRVVESDRVAKAIVGERLEGERRAQDTRVSMTLEELLGRMERGESESIKIIVKTDAQGSVEPVVSSLERLGDEQHRVEILHTAPGNVTESDVNLAIASGAIIIGFNVSVENTAAQLAKDQGVEIRLYDIIYHLIEDVERLVLGLGEPELEEVNIGEAEVRQIFRIRTGAVAGCYVTTGRITRNAVVRVVRGGKVLWSGAIASLRRFTEDVREVREGFECGVALDGFDDFQEGDILEAYVTERVQQNVSR